MAVSSVALIRENERQIYTGDANYYRQFTYFFELRVPARLAPASGGTFLFPLILAPEQIATTEPFAVEITNTEGGSVFVEENGIVTRSIKISGHTGFKPRALKEGVSVTALSALKPEARTFKRHLRSTVLREISGQKHFQYLQDSVFRTYADLKRDPATAAETALIFHNQRDEESWVVIPNQFASTRNAKQPLNYPYDIDLTAVGPADLLRRNFSEDKGILDAMKDKIAFVNDAVGLVAGGVDDLTALVGDLTGTVKDIAKIIDQATTVIGAVRNFVDGVVDFIELPLTFVSALSDTVDEALALAYDLDEAGKSIKKLPKSVEQRLRQIADGLDRIGTHPENFSRSTSADVENTKSRQDPLRNLTEEQRLEALAAPRAASFDELEALGSITTPGDVTAAESTITVGRNVLQFTGAQAITITRGDTLVGLAARYLGDGRLWQYLAALNGLKPPFLNEQATADLAREEAPFYGVLGVGNRIMVPNYAKPPQDLPLLPVLGVALDAPAEEQILGADLGLVQIGTYGTTPLYDVALDRNSGATRPQVIKGVENISQSLLLRLSTEQGADTLYQNVGVGKVAGSLNTVTNVEAARLKYIEALEQDPRVAAVRKLDLVSNGDQLTVDVDVELRSFTESARVQLPV